MLLVCLHLVTFFLFTMGFPYVCNLGARQINGLLDFFHTNVDFFSHNLDFGDWLGMAFETGALIDCARVLDAAMLDGGYGGKRLALVLKTRFGAKLSEASIGQIRFMIGRRTGGRQQRYAVQIRKSSMAYGPNVVVN
jgi:hypothetical protein